MFRILGTWVETIARLTALMGGVVLVGLIVMTCVSIIGRSLGAIGLAPVPGDFELVELGVGFAIFSFLPWCQLQGGHARVDILQSRMSRSTNRVIDMISDTLMFVIAFLIAWRLWIGMLDKKSYSETTFILQLPIWIAYAGAILGAVVFAAVALYCALRSGRKVIGTDP